MARKRYLTNSEIALQQMEELGVELDYMKENYKLKICPKSWLSLFSLGRFVRVKVWKKNYFGKFIYMGSIMQNKKNLSYKTYLYYGVDVHTSLFVTYVYCKYLEGEEI